MVRTERERKIERALETSFLPLSYPTICKVLLEKQLPFTTREIASDSYLSVVGICSRSTLQIRSTKRSNDCRTIQNIDKYVPHLQIHVRRLTFWEKNMG